MIATGDILIGALCVGVVVGALVVAIQLVLAVRATKRTPAKVTTDPVAIMLDASRRWLDESATWNAFHERGACDLAKGHPTRDGYLWCQLPRHGDDTPHRWSDDRVRVKDIPRPVAQPFWLPSLPP
jgi:hypothetical protein